MPEYIEREAVINRLLKVCMTDDVYGMGIQRGVDHAIDVVREAPAADVVAVVRCKECNISTESHLMGDGWRFCMNNSQHHKDEHFCGYGKRRDEDVPDK